MLGWWKKLTQRSAQCEASVSAGRWLTPAELQRIGTEYASAFAGERRAQLFVSPIDAPTGYGDQIKWTPPQ